ncbi:topoisomerase C-terminal repeat-containing protein, partial [Clostridium botulinum]|uniref:topoisomerase C-terminal repeat-containing protein n=1 Tax=Clostridium botulinum TaxID=1491 RepID=UPI0004D03A72
SEIIKKCCMKYIEDKNNILSITDLGIKFIETINKLGINLYAEKTINLSKNLKSVRNGKITLKDCLNNAQKELIAICNNSKSIEIEKIENKKEEKEIIGKCPFCDNGQIVEKKDFFGCDNYKNGCKFSISKKYVGGNITINQVKKLLKNGQTDLINFNGQYGKFKSKIIIDKENQEIKLKKK